MGTFILLVLTASKPATHAKTTTKKILFNLKEFTSKCPPKKMAAWIKLAIKKFIPAFLIYPRRSPLKINSSTTLVCKAMINAESVMKVSLTEPYANSEDKTPKTMPRNMPIIIWANVTDVPIPISEGWFFPATNKLGIKIISETLISINPNIEIHVFNNITAKMIMPKNSGPSKPFERLA